MKPSLRSYQFLLPAIACASALALTSASAARLPRCSKSPLPAAQPSLFFLGSATAETRAADVSGIVDSTSFTGTVQAQLFEMSRFGGSDARAVRSGTTRILVVPWGYESDCTPMKWTAPRWVEPGISGVVYGALRARERWVDGIPTIDVHEPYQLPYPKARLTAREDVSADDAYTLLSVLPTREELTELGVAALVPLMSFVRSRPDLMEREPGMMLRRKLAEITSQNIRALRTPMAGTYRMSLELGDGRTRTFFARTEANPVTARLEPGSEWLAELRPPIARGYTLLVAPATELASLPASRADARYGYVEVSVADDITAPHTEWQASAELSLLRYAFPVDVAVQRIVALGRNQPPTQGAFRMDRNGGVTFLQRYELSDSFTFVLRGERISLETLRPPR